MDSVLVLSSVLLSLLLSNFQSYDLVYTIVYITYLWLYLCKLVKLLKDAQLVVTIVISSHLLWYNFMICDCYDIVWSMCTVHLLHYSNHTL